MEGIVNIQQVDHRHLRQDTTSLKLYGDEAPADHEAAENFVDKFARIIADENLTQNNSTVLRKHHCFGVLVPRETVTTADEAAPTGIKNTRTG